jgi:FKBP-type peptidyl-prolyl cis-trans isomerase
MTCNHLFFLSSTVALLLFNSCSGPSKPAAPQAPLPPGVEQTYSGLKTKVLRPGKGGPRPNSLSEVTAHYKGWTPDGKVFDNSYERGKPSDFPLSKVISGWTEGVQLMTKGEKRRFWIPSRLAYGDAPGDGKPSGDLIFDIELIDFR